MTTEPCEDRPLGLHCWHFVTGWTNSAGTEGEDRERCCWCGEPRTRKWVLKPDPQHGPFESNGTPVYVDTP